MEEDGRGGENCYKVAIFTPLLFIIRVEFSRAPPPHSLFNFVEWPRTKRGRGEGSGEKRRRGKKLAKA